MKPKPTAGWAIINWNKSAIVNNGEGQKQIYRTRKLAEEKAQRIGSGTSVIKVIIEVSNEKANKTNTETRQTGNR